jgi:hypothetical protein
LSSGTDGFAGFAFFRRKGKQKSQSQAKKEFTHSKCRIEQI